ncbi:hypothetical protein ACH5RR_038793 [Cinchona calisaya]|uniref:Uncharacterized protein n=1 Tax=Cinchona calisaya TaxID=153742 RepID=A0ABD2XZC5_9GENT
MSKRKLSLVLVLLFLATSCCIAKKSNHHCPPSSCGDIRNISYPFRLKGDPDKSSSSIPSNSQQDRRHNYSYVLDGDGITIADVEDSCTISMFAWVKSDEFRRITNSTSAIEIRITNSTSLQDIFNGLSYGFVLPFYRVYCSKQCEKRGGSCFLNPDNVITCKNRLWKVIFGFYMTGIVGGIFPMNDTIFFYNSHSPYLTYFCDYFLSILL